MRNFLAVDFETANRSRTSACALGLVYVEAKRVVAEETLLIRPPRRQFEFTHIHGLTWDDVKSQPTFVEWWPKIRSYIDQADFLVAHYAVFDRGVLNCCCEKYGLTPPSKPFECTVQIARQQWDIFPTKLPIVCRYLGIPLQHHDALSDAHACADITLRAMRDGWKRQ